MSQQTQQSSKHVHCTQLIQDIRSKSEGECLYWRALPALARRLHGELVLPGDHAFAALWTTWNTAFAGYPAVIVRCLDAEDVIAAITFARELGMAVSVRSGGHSIAGYGTNYNGMVIDLSPMQAITLAQATVPKGADESPAANAGESIVEAMVPMPCSTTRCSRERPLEREWDKRIF